MAEALPTSTRQQDFWRPPAVGTEPPALALVEVCKACGTEFMMGAGYCHSCGAQRDMEVAPVIESSLLRYIGYLRVLEFQNLKDLLGLGTASLIAFVIGLGCLSAAVLVGWLYSVQNFADFQAIQFWRMQWILAAAAAFLAGILLKRSRPTP